MQGNKRQPVAVTNASGMSLDELAGFPGQQMMQGTDYIQVLNCQLDSASVLLLAVPVGVGDVVVVAVTVAALELRWW